jgi:hypothetical protein
MPGGFGCGGRSEFRERQECFLFVCGQRDVTRQPKHLEKLDGLMINIREDKLRASIFGCVYDAQKNGDAYAVDEFRLAEIDNQRAAAHFQLPATFARDALAAQLVEIIARVNHSQIPDCSRTYLCACCQFCHV